MLIRAERRDDANQIQGVVDAAFDSDGERSAESVLIERLRGSGAWIPQLSLIAEEGERIVGQCLCTRAHVDDAEVLALGPISVIPQRQRSGIGSTLMRTAIEIAIDMSEPLIGLLGDYGYYRRFGFVPASAVGIISPEPSWGDYFQVLVIDERRAPRGEFVYPTPFRDM